MAKKNQHLIPQTYLKGFCNKEIINNQETFNIFISKKASLSEVRKRGLAHSTFTKSYFYNLDNDKENPIIEDNLSKIEYMYSHVLKRIIEKSVSIDDILFISNFTFLQLQRVDSWISNIQNTFDQLAHWADDMSPSSNMKSEVDKIGIKMLLDFKLEEMYKSNIVFEHGVHLIENTTNIPFLISDKPVVHKIYHIDQIQALFNNHRLEYNHNFNLVDRSAFLFFPLSANFALIATKFLIVKNNAVQYIYINDINTILKLNLLTYENAHNDIYSSTKNPFEHHKHIIKAIDEQYDNIGYWAHLYTNQNRYILKLEKYESITDGIELYLKNDTNVKEIIADNFLKEITIYFNDQERRGMKRIELEKFDNEQNILTIRSKLKFGL